MHNYIQSIALSLILMVAGCAGNPGQQFLGRPAPVTLYTQMDGATSAISQFEGRPMVITFWATWCKRSGPILARLNQFAKANRDIPIIAISIDKFEQGGSVKERSARFPYLTHAFSGNDIEDIAYIAWEGDQLPYVAVIDTDGKVAAVSSTDEIVYKFFKIPEPQVREVGEEE